MLNDSNFKKSGAFSPNEFDKLILIFNERARPRTLLKKNKEDLLFQVLRTLNQVGQLK